MKEIVQIPLSKLVRDPENPRESIEEAQEMADSLAHNGQEKPIDIEPLGNGKHLITDGHRREAGFRILAKKQKKEILVDCITQNKMSSADRLLKRCVIDAQQKSLTVPERDKAWKKLWKIYSKDKNFSKASFCKMIGATSTTMTNFIDRMELGEEFMEKLEKGGVGSDVLSETKGLEPDVRKKVLEMAAETGMGCREARQVKKTLKGASATIIDSVTQRDISIEQANKLKGVKESKQKETIDLMKGMQKDVDSVPSLMKGGKIKTEKEKKRMMAAQEFVARLRDEIMDTVNQIAKIEATLETINEDGLDKYFSDAGKRELAKVLDRLQERIKPAIVEIEKQVKLWGGAKYGKTQETIRQIA